ncbi:MAG: GNAT family N-acetyltransferase [Neisseria sp.]|nr:GNAT family N-acetyltransferase [Neisseria sp.]
MFLTHLRPARPDDCRDILAVHRFAVQYTCNNYYNNTVLEAWLALLTQQGYLDAMQHKTLWVVEFKGNIQGFFQLDLDSAELDALYVHPFVHHMGLGTALLQRAERIAFDADLGFLKLYASLNSILFYEINGYEKLGSCELLLNPTVAVQGELMRKFLTAETVV